MKRILLTTTSLVLAAGVAQAEITWSGAATAGIAREGSADAIVGVRSTESKDNQTDVIGAAASNVTNEATYLTFVLATVKADIAAIEVLTRAGGAANNTLSGGTTETLLRADLVLLKASALDMPTATAAEVTAVNTAIRKAEIILDQTYGVVDVAKAAAGDWDTYSEINATATATVAMDNGMSLAVSASVDAGRGYNFADDDGFDAAKTNGVSLDSISLDMGSMGKLTLDEDNIEHLVDADDDATADVSYTNTMGTASVTIVADMDKDTDEAFVKGAGPVLTSTVDVAAAGVIAVTEATTSTVQDVAWSAKASMPLAGGTGYVAMDEEGGNAFGATATLSGVGLSFDSKLEALDKELKADRSNTIGLTYAMGATTFGATWNSVEDGDQWGISAAYAADGLSISASTDEGSDWSISGSMALGGGASLVGGTNYTEDAYVGVSFAF